VLNPHNCWRKAHNIVTDRLKDIVPFGIEHTVIFYIPEGNDSVKATPSVFPAPNHCLHILYLPEVTATPTPSPGSAQSSVQANRNFHDNLMCCYKPW
jgi:hypothetical protein